MLLGRVRDVVTSLKGEMAHGPLQGEYRFAALRTPVDGEDFPAVKREHYLILTTGSDYKQLLHTTEPDSLPVG